MLTGVLLFVVFGGIGAWGLYGAVRTIQPAADVRCDCHPFHSWDEDFEVTPWAA